MTVARPLDPAEALFWMLDQVSSMNFAVYAEGRGALTEAGLRRALSAVQSAHPLLGVAITRDAAGGLHFVPASAPIALQIDGPADDGRQALAQAVIAPFALDAAPLMRACWQRWPDGSWRLALIFQHSIADGRSGFALLWEVLELAGQPAPATQSRPAPPPLHAGFPAHWRGAAAEAAVQALKQARRAELAPLGRPAEQAAYTASAGLALQPATARIELDAASSQALAAAARAAGSSVHGAISAAQLLALASVFEEGATPTLVLTSPVDLRRHLTAAMPVDTPVFGVSLLSSRARIGADTVFWDLARSLSQDLRHCLQRGDGHLLYQLMPRLPASAEGIAQFAQLMAAGPQNSLLSNVGPLAPPPALALSNAGFVLFPMPGQPLFTAVASHAGRLGLNLNYDAARWQPASLAAVVARFASLLHAAAQAG